MESDKRAKQFFSEGFPKEFHKIFHRNGHNWEDFFLLVSNWPESGQFDQRQGLANARPRVSASPLELSVKWALEWKLRDERQALKALTPERRRQAEPAAPVCPTLGCTRQ